MMTGENLVEQTCHWKRMSEQILELHSMPMYYCIHCQHPLMSCLMAFNNVAKILNFGESLWVRIETLVKA